MPPNQSPIGGGGKASAPKSSTPRLTPIQKAASSIGAAKAAPIASRERVLPGPGVTPKQAAAANLGAAKRASQPDTHSYAPIESRITAAHHASGGGLLGAIEGVPLIGGAVSPLAHLTQAAASDIGSGVVAGAKAIGTEAARFGKGAASWATQAPQAIEGLGKAELHDLLHINLGGAALPGLTLFNPQSQVAQDLKQGIVHDPIVQSVEQGSLSPVVHDPFGTAMDVAGGWGAVGKTAGLVGRATGLAGRAAETSPIVTGADEAGRPWLPNAVQTRLPSKNLLTTSVNKALHGRATGGMQATAQALPDVVSRALENNAIDREVAMDTAASTGEERALAKRIQRTMKEAKPGKTEAGIVKHVVGFGLAPEQLPRVADSIATRIAQHEAGVAPLTEQALKNAHQNLAAIRAAINGPLDRSALNQAAAAAKDIIGNQTLEKIGHGALDDTEAARAMAKRVALAHYPNDVHVIKYADRVPHPDYTAELRAASEHVASTGNDLKNATGSLEKKLAASEHNRAIRDMVTLEKNPRYLSGTVIRDPAANQIMHGPLAGQRFRQMTDADAERLLAQHPASYVSMSTAGERTAPTMGDLLGGRMEGRTTARSSAPFTGGSLEFGTDTPGWEGLMNSMLMDNARIGDLKLKHRFLNKWTIGGEPHATEADAKTAADAFEKATGHKAVLMRVQRADQAGHAGDAAANALGPMDAEEAQAAHDAATGARYHVLPERAVEQLQKQLKLDRPTGAARLYAKLVKNFRQTVLGFSTKLPIMHNVEIPVRTALAEGGTAVSPLLPAAKAAYDIGTARRFLSATEGLGTRERLEHQLIPGSGIDIGGGLTTEAEDMGRPAESLTPARQRLRTVGAAYNRVPSSLIKFQRMQARPADMAALGRTLRAMAESEGHTPLGAFAASRANAARYAEELSRRPDLANLAERRLEQEMGQYKSFTAKQRNVHRAATFLPWYRSAAHLLYDPRVAPLTKLAMRDYVLAHQNQIHAQHKGLPADLQSALPLGGGNFEDVGKFLPIPPGQNLGETALSLAAPIAQGPVAAALGFDPFWQPLKAPGYGGHYQPPYSQGLQRGDIGKAAMGAGESLAEELLGPVSPVVRAVAGGPKTLYSGSVPVLHALSGGLIGHDWRHTTRPGGPLEHVLGAPPWVDNLFDPFQPTHWGATHTLSNSPPAQFQAERPRYETHNGRRVLVVPEAM